MKTIKAKINIMMLLILASGSWFGYLAYEIDQKISMIQTQASTSLSLRNNVKRIRPSHKRINKKSLKYLKSLKSYLQQENRRKAASDLVQAYNAKNTRLFKTRIKEFEGIEQKFFRRTQKAIGQKRKHFRFYLVLAASLPLLGFCILFYYFNFGILSPLTHLSARMMEFLIDQYTFRFSNPANNEIGNLERTFNSLAQKVLNNLDELKALDKAKSEFVSIASHELRTPLTSIKGSLGLITSGIVGRMDTEAKELVLVAERETDRLVRIINEMLDLAKIEARSLEMNKDWKSLNELAKQTSEGIQGFATASKTKIQIIPSIKEIEAFIDGDRIQQVLTNLFSNAIKYSPEDGVVSLKIEVDKQQQLILSVADQGPGISEENQALIFEKFRQATDSSNHLVKGTGLGLAISKALVEEHDGHIGVQSQLGHGSCFYFSIGKWRYKEQEPKQVSTQQKVAS